MTPCASRVTIEPTTLQTASVLIPLRRASRWAAMVSAVSPDWVMTITKWSLSRIGSR